MSDEHLRELERRWRETGSVEDEAAWLGARVKAGDLDPEKLEVLEHLGREGARLALASLVTQPSGDPVDFLEAGSALRVKCLRGWPHEAALRLLAATWGQMEAARDSSEGRAGLLALEEWLSCPCQEHAEAVEQQGRFGISLSPESWDLAIQIATLLADVPWTVEGGRPTELTRKAVWDGLRAELVPWLLGYSDPVRERVQARQREAARE